MDMGDCNRKLTMEIDSTMESIRLFSKRVEGLSDDMILYQAESLVEDIRCFSKDFAEMGQGWEISSE